MSSVGGINGQERTPATEGVSIRLDYDGHRVRAYRDGELIGRTAYTATEQATFGPLPTYVVHYAEPLNAFPFDALDEHTVVTVAPNTVRFDDPCCDRYAHTMEGAGVIH